MSITKMSCSSGQMSWGPIMLSKLDDSVRIETGFGIFSDSSFITSVFEKQRVGRFMFWVCVAFVSHDDETKARNWHADLFEMILSGRK
jgi:hypothetical protein